MDRLLTTQQQLESSLKNWEEHRSTLQQQLDTRTLALQVKVREVEDVRSVLAERETALEMSQGDAQILRKKTVDLGTVLEEARGRHLEHQQEVDAMSLEMRQEVVDRQKDITAMQGSMNNKEEEAQELRVRLMKTSTQLDETSNQLEVSMKEISSLHIEKVSAIATIDRLQWEVADIRQHLENRNKELRQWRQKKEEEQQESLAVSHVMQGLQGEITSLQSQIAEVMSSELDDIS